MATLFILIADVSVKLIQSISSDVSTIFLFTNSLHKINSFSEAFSLRDYTHLMTLLVTADRDPQQSFKLFKFGYVVFHGLVSLCQSCDELKKRIEVLEVQYKQEIEALGKKIETLENEFTNFKKEKRKQEVLHILHQIATNIEYEYKIECIYCLPTDKQEMFLTKDGRGKVSLKDSEIGKHSLQDLFALLNNDQLDRLLKDKIKVEYEYELIDSMAKLKVGGNADITELDEKPVTVEVARTLIQEHFKYLKGTSRQITKAELEEAENVALTQLNILTTTYRKEGDPLLYV
jgi:hypothetical protein